MDPNATLAEIQAFLLAQREGSIVDRWCEHIWDWLERGGFEPDWAKYPMATDYYKCRAVHMAKGERVPESEPDYDDEG